MKNCLIFVLMFILVVPAWAGSAPDGKPAAPLVDELPASYQQFKHQFLHNQERQGQPLPVSNYKGQDDYTMLYVAGGLLAVTGGMAYLNSSMNDGGFFSSNNTGLLIGGSFSATIFITKYFIDRYR